MSFHSKKPLALKFNVGKKLGQLMKVIQFFESQLAEMEYQRNFIHLTYDPLLTELIDTYTKEASTLSEQLEKETEVATQKIQKQYDSKLDTLKSDFHAYVESAVSKVDKFENSAIDQIAKLKQSIEKLNKLIDNENENIYLVCFPYTSAMFQTIILKLATATTFDNIKIQPYRDFSKKLLRRKHSEHKIYAEDIELTPLKIQLPKINCYNMGGHIYKDYTNRINAIIPIIDSILEKARNSSTRARKPAK